MQMTSKKDDPTWKFLWNQKKTVFEMGKVPELAILSAVLVYILKAISKSLETVNFNQILDENKKRVAQSVRDRTRIK